MSGKLLTFRIAGQLYGIDITTVKEINRKIHVTSVPDTPAYVIGLMNMRGQIVTLLDLTKLMDAPVRGVDKPPTGTCVILKNKPGELDFIGFAIDELGSVVEGDDAPGEPPPAHLKGEFLRFIHGIRAWKQELILVLEPSAIYNP